MPTALLILCFILLVIVWVNARRWRSWAMRLDEDHQIHEQERQMLLQFMHSFVDAIGSGVTREELSRRVVHSAIISTGALSGCYFELCEENLVAGAVEGLFPPQSPLPKGTNMQISTRARFIEGILRSQPIPVGQGLIGSVAQTGEGLLLQNATNDPRVVQMDDPALALHSMIAVPISFKGRMIAVLALANHADGFHFSQSDFSMAQGIAEQAGLAMHNLDLMEAQISKNKMDMDLALASSIQAMLLPKKLPESPLLDFAALYLPAQKVGGDLYDVFSIDESRVGVAIADVSGKGVPASIIMAICQSNLRHFARSGSSPAKVLSDLNAIMREEMRRDMFVTMIYAIVNTAEDTITFARAGHELPLMLKRGIDSSLTPEFIASDGMALGMARESLFNKIIQEVTLPFGKGEMVVMYTDGITETANQQGAQYGADRFKEAVLDLREESAATINERIFDRVVYFSDGRGQADDVTMLTIKHL